MAANSDDPSNDNVVPVAPQGATGAQPPPTPAAAAASAPKSQTTTGDDLDSAFASKPGEPEYWFDEDTRMFLKRRSDGSWIDLKEQAFRRELKFLGLRDKADPAKQEVMSQIDARIRTVEQDRRVWWSGILSGYKAGIHVMGGDPILVTRSPHLLTPKEGDWSTLRAVFDGMLVGVEKEFEDEEGVTIDQRDYFYGWMQDALECLYRGIVAPGLALAIAGEANAGKSLLSGLLEILFGGRVARPYAAMIGKDNFNKDLFGAMFQLIDDDNAETHIESRLKLGAEIKKITGATGQKCRGIQSDGIELKPLWRLVALLNLEPDRLLVLPPIDKDIEDKMLILKGYKRDMPMPTDSVDERLAFWQRLTGELPAFVWWVLKEYKLPSSARGKRFRVTHWAHPQILSALQQFSPEVRLWQLLQKTVFTRKVVGDADTEIFPVDEWSGTAEELDAALRKEGNGLTMEERKELPKNPTWLGHRLEALRRRLGEKQVTQKRTKKRREWTLRREASA